VAMSSQFTSHYLEKGPWQCPPKTDSTTLRKGRDNVLPVPIPLPW
jgi:hypothetical protein